MTELSDYRRIVYRPERQRLTDRIHELEYALGQLASCAASVMQSNQAGNEPDFVPLMNAYRSATQLLKTRDT